MAVTDATGVASDNDLWITFKLNDDEYCVESRYIVALDIPTEIKDMPHNAEHMLGVMRWNGGTLPIVGMRTLFAMPTIDDAVKDFSVMRQMHLDWIDALENSVKNREPFTKAVDPHKCKFGMWYDNFDTSNISMKFILNKIGPPHEYIHRHGADVQHAMARDDWDEAQRLYNEARQVCEKEVLPLLDELIKTYREVNKGIIIVIRYDDQQLGLMVDEIEQLIRSDKAELLPVPKAVAGNPYIDRMLISDDVTYSAIDVGRLAEYVKHAQETARESAMSDTGLTAD